MIAWLAALAFYLLVVLVVVGLCRAAGVKRPMDDRRHDGLYLEDGVADAVHDLGPAEPKLARLNDDPVEPTTGELRAALRQTAEREGDDWLKALRGEGS